MGQHNLSRGFWSTLRDSQALDLFAGIGEVGLDEFMSGPLKDVPIIGSFTQLWRAGVQVRDAMFVAKLTRFLKCVRDRNHESIARYAREIQDDSDLQFKVGSNILIAIERLDDIEKPELLGRAFLRLAAGEIDYGTFAEFALAIDRCFITDLSWLEDTESRLQMPPSEATRLSACGLLEIEGIPTVRGKGADNNYRMTSLGRALLTLVVRE
jgi:hypothetical protein